MKKKKSQEKYNKAPDARAHDVHHKSVKVARGEVQKVGVPLLHHHHHRFTRRVARTANNNPGNQAVLCCVCALMIISEKNAI